MKKVLDHGFVDYVEHYGADSRVIEAARTSTQKGFMGWRGDECSCLTADGCNPDCPKCGGNGALLHGDEKLLRYLWTHGHVSCFEFAGLIVDVQAPVFVARQVIRHWSLSVNEASARYAPLPELDYMPTKDRLLVNADGTNKQANRAKGAPQLSPDAAEGWLTELDCLYRQARWTYDEGLRVGVPQELARLALTMGAYTKFRLNGTLRDWILFVQKRTALDAQWETRQVAAAIAELLSQYFPRSYEVSGCGT